MSDTQVELTPIRTDDLRSLIDSIRGAYRIILAHRKATTLVQHNEIDIQCVDAWLKLNDWIVEADAVADSGRKHPDLT